MYRTAYNTTDSAVVVDAEGHMVGGFDWGTVDPDSEMVKGLVDSETLYLVAETDTEEQFTNPRAWDAMQSTKAANEQNDKPASVDPSDDQDNKMEAAPKKAANKKQEA